MTALAMPETSTDDSGLVAAARAQDERAIREIMRRHAPRVRSLAGQYFLRGCGGDRDDLIQEGMIALYKAIHDFEASRGVPFAPFADMCVRRQLISAVRASSRMKHAILDDATVLTDRTEPGGVVEQVADPVRVVLAREALSEFQGFAADALTPLERDALELHLDGLSIDESAARLCAMPKAVDNALQRSRRKVRAWAETALEASRPESRAIPADPSPAGGSAESAAGPNGRWGNLRHRGRSAQVRH